MIKYRVRKIYIFEEDRRKNIGGKFFLFSFLLRHCDIFGEKTWWDKVQDKDRSSAWRILVAGKIKQG